MSIFHTGWVIFNEWTKYFNEWKQYYLTNEQNVLTHETSMLTNAKSIVHTWFSLAFYTGWVFFIQDGYFSYRMSIFHSGWVFFIQDEYFSYRMGMFHVGWVFSYRMISFYIRCWFVRRACVYPSVYFGRLIKKVCCLIAYFLDG